MKINAISIRNKHKLYFKKSNKNKTFNACSKCKEATKNKFGTTEYKYLCDACYRLVVKRTNEVKFITNECDDL